MTQTATKPIERFLPLLKGVKSQRYNGQGNPGSMACCPAHTDSTPSLEIWEDPLDYHIGIKCYAGCTRKAIVGALGLTEADLYVDGKTRATPKDGITLFDLGTDKLIRPSILAAMGVSDEHTYAGKKAVYITYYTAEGKPHERYRIRTALSAKEGSFWCKAQDEIIPYGLERLADARQAKYLVIVEGESDCWTLWLHGLSALGIPGVEFFNTIKPEYLTGIDRVYVMQEPDEAGRKFAGDVYKHLQAIGYKGKTYVLELNQSHGVKDPNELHKRYKSAFKATFEQAMHQARLFGAMFTPTIHSLRDLLREKLDPPKWAVRGLIPEGVTILAGPPKMGKSWMALQIGLAEATGGIALQKIPVEKADVLYLALEDNKRRLQSRALQLLSENWNDSLGCFDYVTEWARLNEGGKDALEEWLENHPQARLVVIDTLAKVRPRHTNKASMYDDDYADMAHLKTLADTYHCAIVLIHHTRKASAEDPNDEISGSRGLSGSVDCNLVLKRDRGKADAVLHVSGRDVDEQELAITFSTETGFWTLAGDAENFRLTQDRQEIIDVIHDLTKQNTQTTPLEIQKALNVSREKPKSRESVRYLLSKMTNAGDVTPFNGIYIANRPYSANTPNTPNTPNRYISSVEDTPNSFADSHLANEPIEPIASTNGHSSVRAVSDSTFAPLTGVNPAQNGNHSNFERPVRAVSDQEQKILDIGERLNYPRLQLNTSSAVSPGRENWLKFIQWNPTRLEEMLDSAELLEGEA